MSLIFVAETSPKPSTSSNSFTEAFITLDTDPKWSINFFAIFGPIFGRPCKMYNCLDFSLFGRYPPRNGITSSYVSSCLPIISRVSSVSSRDRVKTIGTYQMVSTDKRAPLIAAAFIATSVLYGFPSIRTMGQRQCFLRFAI